MVIDPSMQNKKTQPSAPLPGAIVNTNSETFANLYDHLTAGIL